MIAFYAVLLLLFSLCIISCTNNPQPVVAPPPVPPLKAKYQVAASLQEAIGWYIGTAGYIDNEKAKMLFTQAAQSGDPLAQMWLARCYLTGRAGFPAIPDQGQQIADAVINQVRQLALQDVPEAIFLMGAAYYEGLAVPENKVQAAEWYQQAAVIGHINSMANLGALYNDGEGVAQDINQAMQWHERAARSGSAFAMTNLGRLYEKQSNFGNAYQWYQNAAQRRHPYAQYKLGAMYENGNGVSKNVREAMKWYLQSAQQGHIRSQYRLGVLYEQNANITNKLEAIKWYRLAADQDYAPAQFELVKHSFWPKMLMINIDCTDDKKAIVFLKDLWKGKDPIESEANRVLIEDGCIVLDVYKSASIDIDRYARENNRSFIAVLEDILKEQDNPDVVADVQQPQQRPHVPIQEPEKRTTQSSIRQSSPSKEMELNKEDIKLAIRLGIRFVAAYRNCYKNYNRNFCILKEFGPKMVSEIGPFVCSHPHYIRTSLSLGQEILNIFNCP